MQNVKELSIVEMHKLLVEARMLGENWGKFEGDLPQGQQVVQVQEQQFADQLAVLLEGYMELSLEVLQLAGMLEKNKKGE